MDERSAAEILFGDTTPTEQKETPPVETKERTQAEILFGDTAPPEQKQHRPSEPTKQADKSASDDRPKAEDAPKEEAPAKVTADDVNEVVQEAGFMPNEITEMFTEFAQENNLSKESLNNLMALKREHDAEIWHEIDQQWVEETKQSFNDDDIKMAADLVDRFASDEFRDLLTTYRMGNNPHVIQFLYTIAREMDNEQI